MATPAPPVATGDATRMVDYLLARYGESHQNPVNELIHGFAVPLIVFSLLGLLHWVHPYLALGASAASVVYYARLSTAFMIVMTLTAALCLYIVAQMDSDTLLVMSAGIFAISWIFQFIGHQIEGKKPSFFEDLQYLLVGPLFVLSRLFLKLGWTW
jgi:uncharacterized membrane protein YGL010W